MNGGPGLENAATPQLDATSSKGPQAKKPQKESFRKIEWESGIISNKLSVSELDCSDAVGTKSELSSRDGACMAGQAFITARARGDDSIDGCGERILGAPKRQPSTIRSHNYLNTRWKKRRPTPPSAADHPGRAARCAERYRWCPHARRVRRSGQSHRGL